jgi:hypothetical protein
MDIEFISVYRNLLTSDKLKKESSILNIFFENQRTCSFNSNIITNNEEYIIQLKSPFQTIVIDKLNDLINFIDDIEKDEIHYDIILFVNLFSFHRKESIDGMLEIFANKSNCIDTNFVFINEIICKNTLLNHPLSFIRNVLFNLTNFNYGRSVSINEVYSILRKNSYKVIDSTRILSKISIPTYPVEYFMIITTI